MTELPHRQVEGKNDDIELHMDTDTGERVIIYRCSLCGATQHISAPNRQVFEWLALRYPVQKAFPNMSVELREALVMKCCVDCSNKIWANLSEEDD